MIIATVNDSATSHIILYCRSFSLKTVPKRTARIAIPSMKTYLSKLCVWLPILLSTVDVTLDESWLY